MGAEPETLEALGWHVAGARDGATAGRRSAVAGEGLGHGPFGGRVEELWDLVSVL